MTDALLRNVDEDLLADYRAQARANGRSLQAELKDGLKRGRPRRRLTKEQLLELSKELTSESPVTRDSTSHIRWARDTDEGRFLGEPRRSDDRP